MARFVTNIDLGKNELQNARVQNLAAPPANPMPGQVYYDAVANVLMAYNGAAWRPLDPAKLTDGSIPNTALATNPLARASHTGTQLASTISDFATTVRANRLDQMAAPTAAVGMNGQRVTSVATPTSGTDAANKQYVDDVVASISWKDEVRVATVAAGTLSTSFANGSVVDGTTLATGDRILIKNQAAAAENGLYVVNATGAPTRSSDADTGAKIQGSAVFVTSGTVNGGKRFVCNTTGTITLGTSAIGFVQFDGGTTYVAGDGLSLSGATFSVGAGTGVVVGASTVGIDTAVVCRKFSATIGNGSMTSIPVAHGLGNSDVIAEVREVATNQRVFCDITNTDANTVTLSFAAAPTANQYRVTVIG